MYKSGTKIKQQFCVSTQHYSFAVNAFVDLIRRFAGEEFVIVRRDPSKAQFIARLNDFYFQFQKLANNCAPVKVI